MRQYRALFDEVEGIAVEGRQIFPDCFGEMVQTVLANSDKVIEIKQ